jgi:beta-lactamase regulating signal transducer with metallopeptidase domain
MSDLFAFAAHNTIAAFVLAIIVYVLTRVWRNPPVAHVLWLLVLLKLLAPPVVRIDWSPLAQIESIFAVDQVGTVKSRTNESLVESGNPFIDRPPTPTAESMSAKRVAETEAAADVRIRWAHAEPVLLGLWIGGAAICAMVIAIRIVRLERVIRATLPASERLLRITSEIGRQLGIPRAPDVRYAECVAVPLLWCAGKRPTILLPRRLLSQLDDQQAAMILAHELAHLRRRDHRVRVFEMLVAIVYWWNPLVWLTRRQIHQAEDLCCDAWVRRTFPNCERRYAETMLQTAESLSASQVDARLLPASPLLHSLKLKARIEMILESRIAPSVGTRSRFVLALLAFLVLPLFIQSPRTEAGAGSKDAAPATTAARPETPPTSEFPYAVKFEQGATQFSHGDQITIAEVRGTSETFTPGNIYWIRGTYTLASHDSAMLAAYTTALDAESATGFSYKAQTTNVSRGTGTFTLFLPMSCRGWPHVSFYGNRESFGGNYFGTGASVLKRWWGSKETD